MTRPTALRRAGLIAFFVALALSVDLLVIAAAVRSGVVIKLWFATLRVHDPSRPIAVAALLAGILAALGWQRARAAALTAFVAVGAAAAALITSAGARVYPTSDIALIELYTREAMTGRLLVGAYSRFGWHHPGPAYFYLLAPLYAIAGRNTAALCAGALVLSLSAVAITAWTTSRYAGTMSSAAILAATAVSLWRVDQLIDSPWNAHVVVLPAITLIALGAALAGGAIIALPGAALAATLLIQTDVAVAPYAAAVVGVGFAGLLLSGRGDPRGRRRWRGMATLTAWLLAAAWFLPAAEAVSHRPGNITALLRFFADDARGQSPVDAIAIWSDALTAPLRADFTLASGRSVAPSLSRAHVLLSIALVATAAGAAAWAFRVGLFGLAWLGLTASVGSLVALWSVTRITGGFNDHQAFWFASIGLVDAAVAAAAVGESIRRLHAVAASGARLIAPVAHGALLSAILLLGLYQVDRARRGSFPITATLASIAVFDDSIGQYLAREHLRKPLFRIAGERWDLAVGMLQELHRRGIPFAVEDSWMPMFPDRFRASGDEDAELTITGAFDAAELTVRVGNVTINRSARARVEAIRISPSPR